MRSGVDNFVGGEGVREVYVSAGIAKAELQHRHAGDVEPLAEFMHVGSNVTEILGEKWKSAQYLF